MKIYNYDLSGYFLSESEAKPNPLEKDQFLFPARSTTKSPLNEKADNKIKWNGQDWIYEPIEKDPEPTTEEIFKEAQLSKISICKSYLDRTDWKPIREIDLAGSYQDSDKLNRNLARTAINDLEDLTTLEQVEAYDITKFES